MVPVDGKKVRALREQLRLGLKDIAERTALSMGYLSDIENDKHRFISTSAAESLATGLRVTVDDLTMDRCAVVMECEVRGLSVSDAPRTAAERRAAPYARSAAAHVDRKVVWAPVDPLGVQIVAAPAQGPDPRSTCLTVAQLGTPPERLWEARVLPGWEVSLTMEDGDATEPKVTDERGRACFPILFDPERLRKATIIVRRPR